MQLYHAARPQPKLWLPTLAEILVQDEVRVPRCSFAVGLTWFTCFTWCTASSAPIGIAKWCQQGAQETFHHSLRRSTRRGLVSLHVNEPSCNGWITCLCAVNFNECLRNQPRHVLPILKFPCKDTVSHRHAGLRKRLRFLR